MHMIFRGRFIFWLILALGIFSTSSARELSGIEKQNLISSIELASQMYKVPKIALFALYLQEGGWPGARIEVSGSADVGVFQFNTAEENWMPIIEKELGFNSSELQWSVPISTIAAAYVLSVEYKRTNNWIEAMGNYNRHVKDSARTKYVKSISSHLRNLYVYASTHSEASWLLDSVAANSKSLERRTAGINFE